MICVSKDELNTLQTAKPITHYISRLFKLFICVKRQQAVYTVVLALRRSISSLLLLLLLGPPRSSSSIPAGHPLAAGVRLASHPSIHPSMAVAMMHYFFFRRHRRDDDGGGEQDMLLRESFLRRMEEGAAAAAARDQRRSPPTLTPTPRRCYSREAGYRFVRVNQLNRCIQLVIISLRLFFSCSTWRSKKSPKSIITDKQIRLANVTKGSRAY